MANQNWAALLNAPSQLVTATTFTGTSITDVSPPPDFSFAAGALTPGTILRVEVVGAFVSSSGATTLTVQLMYGGTGGTSLWTSGAVTLTTSAGNPFHIEGIIRILTAGTAGTAAVYVEQHGISTTANAATLVTTRSASVGSINTTTSNSLIVAATAGVALTSFNVDTFTIEQLN